MTRSPGTALAMPAIRRIADRRPTMSGLAQMVALAGVALAALVVAGPRLTAWLGAWTGGAPAGTLLVAALLFGPVSVLLATVSPYAIRLAAGDLDRLGGTAGGLYAVSTVGSLAGALGCTFALIPFLDLSRALSWLLIATAVTALAAALVSPRTGLLTPGLAVLLALFGLAGRPLSVPGLGGLVYQRTTPYQSLRVWDRGPTRYLESDRVIHGGISLVSGEPTLGYVRTLPLALVFDPRARSMLVLGMGSGGAATYLQSHRAGLEVDLVDVDPAVPEVARRLHGLSGRPVHAGARGRCPALRDGLRGAVGRDLLGYLHRSGGAVPPDDRRVPEAGPTTPVADGGVRAQPGRQSRPPLSSGDGSNRG